MNTDMALTSNIPSSSTTEVLDEIPRAVTPQLCLRALLMVLSVMAFSIALLFMAGELATLGISSMTNIIMATAGGLSLAACVAAALAWFKSEFLPTVLTFEDGWAISDL